MAKLPKWHLEATCILMIPDEWDRFRVLANTLGTTASSLLRGFIQRELKRAEKAAK